MPGSDGDGHLVIFWSRAPRDLCWIREGRPPTRPCLIRVFLFPVTVVARRQAKRTKVHLKIMPPPNASKRYSKTLGKYNIGVLGARGNAFSSTGPVSPTSPKSQQDLGSLCVSMR